MVQVKKRKKTNTRVGSGFDVPASSNLEQRLHEAGAIFLFALTGYLLLCLLTYSIKDPGFSHTDLGNGFVNGKDLLLVHNAGGKLGAWFADVMYYFFGYLSYWIPFSLAYISYQSYKKSAELVWPPNWVNFNIKLVGFMLALFAGSGLASLYIAKFYNFINYFRFFENNLTSLLMGPGGLVGKIVSSWFVLRFNLIGSTVLLLAGVCIGITLITGLSWMLVMENTGKKVLQYYSLLIFYCKYCLNYLINRLKNRVTQEKKINTPILRSDTRSEMRLDSKKKTASPNEIIEQNLKPASSIKSESISERALSLIKKAKPNIEQVAIKPKNLTNAKQLSITAVSPEGLPDVGLLELPDVHNGENGYSELELQDLSRLVEAQLLDFGVQAEVVGVQPGPVIVRFELQLAPGTKASKISGLAKDIARSLSIVSVRVVEVIPGKPYVGLEVPNTYREIVRLRELLEHPEYTKSKSPLTLVLGKDISGKIKLADLGKMPHLLVAGTTGSGKSVGVNAMLLSILFKATPKEVRLIMIDPKMLELSVYEGIPHLLAPVVTDMKDAANALKWCVSEMDRRYKLMAALGVRNLASCNKKIEDSLAKGEPILDPLWPEDLVNEPAPQLEPLPYIVVVVDEFADMIMVVGRKVEELIARIAQKARAAGIHMILATQRPSVDVITGLIKANVPTRIAFQVSSKIDSRTILDQQGAEQLLGQGDMLYLPPGVGVPVRVHGAFVSDKEVHAVADDWRIRQAPDYDEDILRNSYSIPGLPKLATDDYEEDTENDELYDQAVQFVLETRKASISSVQRRFKIGYNRAARIVEQMEAAGIVGAMGSKGGREVLLPEGQGVD